MEQKISIGKHRYRSIQIKMGVILLSVTTLFFAGFGYYQYAKFKTNQIANLNNLARFAVERLAENLITPLWDIDKAQINKVISSEMGERSVSAIIVKNPQAKIIAGKIRTAQGELIELTNDLTGDFLTSRQELVKEKESLGSVEIYLTRQFMNAALRRELLDMAVTVLILDFLLFIVLGVTVRKMLVLPVNQFLRIGNAIAEGDLKQDITFRQADEMGALANAFRAMVAKLIQVVQEVKAAVNTIAKNSQELSASAEALSEGTSQQAAATEEASSSMQEMSANIRQNADHARQTEALARQSVAYAEESGRVVAETVIAMQQIVDQISVIQDIAHQTRLLSLNATIEASRAQDYGKAFGVVAHEVRELANTTRVAAETIVKLASSSLDVSQKAGTMLATLVPNIQKTAELVQEISAASAEQSAGVEQINRAVQQLDRATQMTAATAEEVASAAEMLAKQAEQLQQTIGFFTLPETSAGPLAADADLLNALQTLAAKGASAHALGALVKSMLAAPTAESSAPEPPSADPNAPDRKPGTEQSASTPQGHAFEISSTPETADARDDEFERY